MFRFIKKSLANKILVAMATSILLIMGTEVLVRIYFGTRDRVELISVAAKELASSTYAGIKHPMAMGDAQAIMEQMKDIRHTAEDIEVFICDFEQEVIYSTHEEKLRTRLSDIIRNRNALNALEEILVSGKPSQSRFVDDTSGRKHFVYFFPILNQPDCHHCHGASREVLGTMAIRMNIERAYETVADQRNRTIFLTLLGISLVSMVTWFVVNRFVKRPVRDLAEKARRFAEGDMTVAYRGRTEDEIGVLGETFNHMVGAVSSARRSLEEEIARKTGLLNERTRLITLLEKANRELRQLDELKSTFLANMSHELRTPMNSIIGYTDLLIDGVDGPVNSEQAKSLEKIASNSRYLLQLINDILDISKIESGKMKLSPREIDLNWVIQSAVTAFEPALRKKDLQVSYEVEPEVSRVFGDEDAIRQILMNLISNAVKFTEKGTIRITAGVSERGVEPGRSPVFAEVRVEDTGVGIREEDLDVIFDKFVQVDLTTVRQQEGTGLGLSIARGLVALHKGMIWATSEYGKGSCFRFTIPLSREVLEGSAEPVIELRMADALADYFGTPVETFLKPPHFAGRQIRCWHYARCGHPSCPAYGSEEGRCWLILGTHCAGLKIASYPEKVEFCKGCELIENVVLKEAAEALPGDREPGGSRGGSEKVVLAVDDNPDNIDILKKFVGDEYVVVGLLSGESAALKAKAIRPAAITLDILMPGKDGWQVLRELKEDPETLDIPVIIISILDDRRMAFSLGAAEYITKPLAKDVLLKKLRNLEGPTPVSRILIVDSDAEIVRLIGRVLEEAGYEVTLCYNSTDAIRHMEDFRPHMVILSLGLPREEGLDVIEFIKTREEVRNLPLIILTTREFTAPEINALNGRIKAILNKGFLGEQELARELKNCLRKVSEGRKD
ncbi:MAG: response regulator [Deltaproteobacteria bacterium]|nr:response regulator [Deltaproteobacteria bacterium]